MRGFVRRRASHVSSPLSLLLALLLLSLPPRVAAAHDAFQSPRALVRQSGTRFFYPMCFGATRSVLDELSVCITCADTGSISGLCAKCCRQELAAGSGYLFCQVGGCCLRGSVLGDENERMFAVESLTATGVAADRGCIGVTAKRDCEPCAIGLGSSGVVACGGGEGFALSGLENPLAEDSLKCVPQSQVEKKAGAESKDEVTKKSDEKDDDESSKGKPKKGDSGKTKKSSDKDGSKPKEGSAKGSNLDGSSGSKGGSKSTNNENKGDEADSQGEDDSDGSGVSTGVVVGALVASVLVLSAIAGVVFFCCCRKPAMHIPAGYYPKRSESSGDVTALNDEYSSFYGNEAMTADPPLAPPTQFQAVPGVGVGGNAGVGGGFRPSFRASGGTGLGTGLNAGAGVPAGLYGSSTFSQTADGEDSNTVASSKGDPEAGRVFVASRRGPISQGYSNSSRRYEDADVVEDAIRLDEDDLAQHRRVSRQPSREPRRHSARPIAVRAAEMDELRDGPSELKF